MYWTEILAWEWNIPFQSHPTCRHSDFKSWNKVNSLHIWIPIQKKTDQVPEFFSIKYYHLIVKVWYCTVMNKPRWNHPSEDFQHENTCSRDVNFLIKWKRVLILHWTAKTRICEVLFCVLWTRQKVRGQQRHKTYIELRQKKLCFREGCGAKPLQIQVK